MLDIRESGINGVAAHSAEVNGLTVCVVPKPGYRKKYAAFATNFGSIDTRFRSVDGAQVEVPDGIAHFLEHKMFESARGSVMDLFAELGASCNAYTGYTNTTYVVSATDRFEEALELLLGFVQRPEFTPQGVEKEKPIIEQELRMYMDMPNVRVSANLMAALYQNHPVRVDIGGSVESIHEVNYEQLRVCHGSFYRPGNMVLVVVGDVCPESVVESVLANVKEPSSSEPVERFYANEPADVGQSRIELSMPVALPMVLVGYKDVAGHKRPELTLRRDIAGDILMEAIFGRSSELYEELYEERLIADRFSARYSAEPSYGYAVIGGETPKPDELASRIQQALAKARKAGIDHAAIERLKRKMLGDFVMSFDSPEYTAGLFVDLLFKGVHPFDYTDLLDSTDESALAPFFDEVFEQRQMSVSIVKP